ncbi:MAG: Metalloregulator ArsR/SmtB family transcription factor, partial [Chloroflexota bacterium]|nr:Metalloregulator ArsR/SmtB family transcription factor [Chloroflexota bacterium]
MDADLLTGLRALVDQHRLRIVGRLAAGHADPETLAGDLKLPLHVVRKQVEVLMHAGLVEARADRPGTLGARMDRIGQLGRALAVMEREAEGLPGLPGGAWPHDDEPLADTL